jgi:hypothetical protein
VSAVYALSDFSIFVTSTGLTDSLQVGDQRDSADAVVVQAPQLFSAAAPTAATVTGVEEGYLQQDPFGPDDPAMT